MAKLLGPRSDTAWAGRTGEGVSESAVAAVEEKVPNRSNLTDFFFHEIYVRFRDRPKPRSSLRSMFR